LTRLRESSRRWDVSLVSLRATDEETRQAALALDMETPFHTLPENNLARATRSVTVPNESSDALLVRRTLRSGQVVRHPGSVVVVGDVNAGAEIVAGGDVVVWGTLRGVVHAGAMGDDSAVVCALTLAPTQLRISAQIAVSPEEQKQTGRWFQPWKRLASNGPERARLHDDHIIVERWPEK
jgi:septum site-determining protein MinC